MVAPALWRIASLTPSRRDDFLGFFDHERGRAFADNPAWADCYCHFFHAAPALDWPSLPAHSNRTAIAARIDVAEMEGFLAYDDANRVVGWLNAQPRHKLPHCFARLEVEPPPIDVPVHEAAVMLCFVIDPDERRKGMATALAKHALDSFAQRGVRVVDAFPTQAAKDAAGHFRGPLSLYATLGFARLRASGDTVTMRRILS
ncbi:MAG TPA: GNAT family N-acetyltransferase [Casimicrobiaceae bacterium]|nr:GNAT family N-acetyltransferase [Casimicrobiaceae bacterium]